MNKYENFMKKYVNFMNKDNKSKSKSFYEDFPFTMTDIQKTSFIFLEYYLSFQFNF